MHAPPASAPPPPPPLPPLSLSLPEPLSPETVSERGLLWCLPAMCPALSCLDLDGCGLEGLPRHISRLSALTSLSLAENFNDAVRCGAGRGGGQATHVGVACMHVTWQGARSASAWSW